MNFKQFGFSPRIVANIKKCGYEHPTPIQEEAMPKVMAGKPVIKGTRLTVQYILELIADGTNFENITEEYKSLTKEDIIACLHYASESIDHPTFLPLNNEA